MAQQQFIPTGSVILDLTFGGGWPVGRLINLVGDSSSGKSLLAIEACANFASQFDGDIFYYDTEAAFDQEYADAVGFPKSAQVITDIETIEDFFLVVNKFVEKAKKPALIVLDSLDGLPDISEKERDPTNKATYGVGKAKVLSNCLNKIVIPLRQKDITLLIVSQTRDKIGVMFGDRLTRTGGRALKFYSSLEVWLSIVKKLGKTIKGHRRIYGVEIKSKIKKSRIGSPHRECSFELHFRYGIEDLLTCASFLDEAGELHNTGFTMKEISRIFIHGEQTEYDDALDKVQEKAEELWNQIEETFTPRRVKYDREG